MTQSLRVLTYNIHKGIGGVDRRYEPERVAQVIAHYAPDVVLLQEVDADAPRSNLHRQVDWFGDALGLPHRVWEPNVQVRGGGSYGNAILSRFPLVSTRNVDLTVSWRKRRSVLHAELHVRAEGHQRTLHVFNMHLGLAQSERRTQLASFLACAPLAGLHTTTPVIVGGDLNDVYGGLGKILEPAGFACPPNPPRTFPAWAPLRALDGLYVRGASITHVGRGETELAKRASDHRPLYADVAVDFGA